MQNELLITPVFSLLTFMTLVYIAKSRTKDDVLYSKSGNNAKKLLNTAIKANYEP